MLASTHAESAVLAGRAVPRVLFVDDDARILAGVEGTVQRAAPHWDARFALGGDAALELIAAERFDAIVCDLSMLGVDASRCSRARVSVSPTPRASCCRRAPGRPRRSGQRA